MTPIVLKSDLIWVTNHLENREMSSVYHILGKEKYEQWLKMWFIGPPKATQAFTAEQLIQLGYVGLYRRNV